jgi:hypothetical protein
MNLLKGLLSGTCLVLVAAGTGICLYELYNSYFSSEPKNVITYHLATANTADDIQTTYEDVITDGFDNSSFSSSDTIQYTESGSSLASESKLRSSFSKLMFLTYRDVAISDEDDTTDLATNNSFAYSDEAKANDIADSDATNASDIADSDATNAFDIADSDYAIEDTFDESELQYVAGDASSVCVLTSCDDDYFYFLTPLSWIGKLDNVYINIDLNDDNYVLANVTDTSFIEGTAQLLVERAALDSTIDSELFRLQNKLELNEQPPSVGNAVIYVIKDNDGSYNYYYGNISDIIEKNATNYTKAIICTDFEADLSSPGVLFDVKGHVLGVYTDDLRGYCYKMGSLCITLTENSTVN